MNAIITPPLTYEICAILFSSARNKQRGKPLRNIHSYAYLTYDAATDTFRVKREWSGMEIYIRHDNSYQIKHEGYKHHEALCGDILIERTLGVYAVLSNLRKHARYRTRLNAFAAGRAIDDVPLYNGIELLREDHQWKIISDFTEPQLTVDTKRRAQLQKICREEIRNFKATAKLCGWDQERRRDNHHIQAVELNALEDLKELEITEANYKGLVLGIHFEGERFKNGFDKLISHFREKLYEEEGAYSWQ